MNFDFILDDWKKIPPGTKYIFGLGFLLIFLLVETILDQATPSL